MSSYLLSILGRTLGDEALSNALIKEGGLIKPAEQIEDDTDSYISYKDRGISFNFDGDLRLKAIHLHGDSGQGYEMYKGTLPYEVSFGDKKPEVHSKAGEPSCSGGGKRGILGDQIPIWERFDLKDTSVHFQYSLFDGGVDLVTLIARSALPIS